MSFKPPVLPVHDPGCTLNWERLQQDLPGLVTQTATTTVVAGASFLTGEMKMFAGGTVPSGWVLCDGALLSKSTYAALYSTIGDTWSYDGPFATTFRVPDLRSRVPIGVGTNPGLTTRNLGDYGGSQDTPVVAHNHGTATGSAGTHSHTVTDVGGFFPNAQSSSLSAGVTGVYVQQVGGGSVLATTADGAHTHSIATDGVSGVGKNIQPFAAVNFIIKT